MRFFIGSSSNGVIYAEALRNHMKAFACDEEEIKCDIWSDPNMFDLNYAAIDSLFRIADELKEDDGYAVLLFTPDDEVRMNSGFRRKGFDKAILSPRDNVVFELGLFLGRLGRKRVICLSPRNIDMRVMSDWQGMMNVQYDFKRTYTNGSMIEPAQTIIRAVGMDEHTYINNLFL